MKAKKIAALILAATVMASSVSACGVNKSATVATLDGENITLGVVNFICRYMQAGQDDSYRAYMGQYFENWWAEDMMGTGSTTQEDLKQQVVELVHECYSLQAHMDEYKVEITDDEKSEIKKVAEAFIGANSKKAIDEMGATQDIVEEMLTLNTVKSKMHAAMIADIDTNVSDEEANMRAYSMVKIDAKGKYDEDRNYVEYTEDEAAMVGTVADTIASAVESGKTLEEAAEANGQTVDNGHYDADDETIDASVKEALDGLKEGETSGTIKTDDAYYIVRVDKDTDEEETAKNRENIIKDRQDEAYESKLQEWQDAEKWSLKDKALEQIQFKNFFTQISEEQKQKNESESVDQSSTEAAEQVETTESAE